MSRLLLTVDYPRCPTCGAVSYPAWATEHRPGCPNTHSNPDEWSKK